ncbi:hypothetical protein HQ584_01680 [Patescibacteria group bacterium]|nr:hypothetical protein [Patescibacteria group bacterium]
MWKILSRNKGKITGGLIGLVAAFLLIFAWPIILVGFLIIMGVFLGEIFDILKRAQIRIEEILPKTSEKKKEK